MSEFLKNIKSLFIIEEEIKPEAAVPENTEKQKPETPVKGTVTPSVSEGKVNEKFIGVLFEAMSLNNLEGFDYIEFKQSLKSLANMPMDETTRYKSAFAMAQTMGVNAEKLIASANHYLAILQTENDKFAEAVNKQRVQQIGNKEEQITQLDQAIKQKTEQIRQLTLEMEQHTAEMEKLKAEISHATVKVESTKNDFIVSFQTLTAQINADIENMKKYLK